MLLAAGLGTALLHGAACVGQGVATAQGAGAAQAAAGGQGVRSGQRVPLDRVVAVVNGDLILGSDVEAEEQQLQLQPEPPITDEQVDAQLALLRKVIPACAAYLCETDAGWAKFIAAQGVTMEELRERWRMELGVLRFIDERFRMGIRILPADVDAYYQKTMVPAYRKENVTPPAEATISDRIQEILLQERVTALLDDWLKALRAQGTVKIVKPGEAMP
jgi:peptidyl-prolyl cis-trans isomerase SurA